MRGPLRGRLRWPRHGGLLPRQYLLEHTADSGERFHVPRLAGLLGRLLIPSVVFIPPLVNNFVFFVIVVVDIGIVIIVVRLINVAFIIIRKLNVSVVILPPPRSAVVVLYVDFHLDFIILPPPRAVVGAIRTLRRVLLLPLPRLIAGTIRPLVFRRPRRIAIWVLYRILFKIDVDVFLLVVVIRECTSHARECGSGIAAHHSRIESDIPSAKHSAGSEQHPKHKSGYVEHYPNPTSYMRSAKPPVWMTPPEEGARRGRMSATADRKSVMPARARAGATHSPLYCGSSSTRYIWQVPSRNDKTHKSDLWVLFPKDDVFIPPRPKRTLCSTTCVLRPRRRPRGRRVRTQDSRRPAMTPRSCQRRSSRRY